MLRNSAKWTRNFGRRVALCDRRAAVKRPKRLFSKNTGLCEFERRPQSIGPSDCLAKTQVSAKARADV